MILTCPECATRYLAKEGSIGPNGRTVRCSKCETTWFAASELDELALKDNQVETIATVSAATVDRVNIDKVQKQELKTPEYQAGAHVDIRNKADNRRRSRRVRSVALIWLVPLMFLISAFGLALTFRQDIVRKWPKTATHYKQLGIEVSISGLKIEDLIIRNTLIENKNILVVNGKVRNISSTSQNVPLVRLSLHNKAGAELAAWFVDTESKFLEKGGRVDFISEYPNPPLDGAALHYQFDDSSGVLSEDVGKIPQIFEE